MKNNQKKQFISGVPLEGSSKELFDKLKKRYKGVPNSRIVGWFASIGAEKLLSCSDDELDKKVFERIIKRQ